MQSTNIPQVLSLRIITLAVAVVASLAACNNSSPTDSTAINTSTGPNDNTMINSSEASPSCTKTSWFGGVVDYCNGHLIYRDYVYDDYGADTGVISGNPSLLNVTTRAGIRNNPFATTPGLLSPTAGDITYPAGAESTADLVDLDVSIQGGQLQAVFKLNALYTPNQTIAAVAVDTDNNPNTGSVKLMGLTVKGADAVYEFKQGDPVTNTITGTFPLPASANWSMWAVTAQGNRKVMNVAFRGFDEQADATGGIPNQFLPNKGNWWEDKQAAALKAGDISAFKVAVATADLTGKVSREMAVTPGFRQRVYTSAHTVPNSTGEGMNMKGVPGRHGDTQLPCEQYFNFFGKYQPYGIYIPGPNATGKPKSLQVVMHGCEANHASQINQVNMQKQFGDALDRILVAPLGRGPYGFYSDISERDVLDVLADVEKNFVTDKERVFSSGYSMGGYGSMRLAALYPDRFAGIANWVGFTGDISNTPLPGNPLPAAILSFSQSAGASIPPLSSGTRIGAVGNIIDFLGNLRHIPGVNSYATADELVQINTSLALAQRYSTSDVPYAFYLHAPAEHLTFIALDEWSKEAAYTKNLSRVVNPGRVTFRTDESIGNAAYNIKYDKAYWLSQITGRGTGYIDLDVDANGCGKVSNVLTPGQTAGIGPVPWVETFNAITGSKTNIASNTLTATLKNVKSVTLDTAATCLTAGTRYTVTTDGATRVSFSDGRVLNLTTAGTFNGTL